MLSEAKIQTCEPIKIEPLQPFGVRLKISEGIESIVPGDLDRLIKKEKLVLIQGMAAPDQQRFLEFCRGFKNRSILEWSFGAVMNLVEQSEPSNYLFSSEAVPLHWDGAFHEVPMYLVFSCVEAPGDDCGGETIFCNTEKVYNDLSLGEKDRYSSISLTYETEKLAHYGGKFTVPLVQTHAGTGANILRFAEPVETQLNPVHLTVHGLNSGDQAQSQERFINDLTKRLYHDQYMYKHQWQTGDLLFADNHSLVHGRIAFKKNSPRHIRRIQLL